MSSFLKNTLRAVISLASGFLLLRTIIDFYHVAPGVGSWLGRFSPLWGIAFLAFTAFCMVYYLLITFVLWFPGKTGKILPALIKARNRLGILRWFLAVAIVVLPPVFFLFTKWGASFTTPYLRLFALITSSIVFAGCVSQEEIRLIGWNDFLTGSVTIASVFLVGQLVANITTYPFALSWSEGNRLYDYSLYTDPSRYQFADQMETPYGSPGRYTLWGIPFLIPGTSIWLHRLWDTLLWSVPCLILGLLLSRWSNLAPKEKWLVALWIFLFLSQGPIYPPLILSAILVVLFVRSGRWVISLIGAAIATYYASASRWTWLPASPSWAALILLAEFKLDPGFKWTRVIRGLIPIAAIALFSLGIGSLANPFLYSPKELSTSLVFSQPLLWYRLLPNPTYSYGIIGGILLAICPLVILLIWMAISKRWSLNWLQLLAGGVACLIFLAMGIVASVKIGGGSNLHNLDILLITLAILSGLMLRQTRLTSTNNWPKLAQIMLVVLFLLPCWDAFRTGSPLVLPPQQLVSGALNTIQEKVSRATEKGDVLFIDQRQLITFDAIKNVPLVSEYEKKYLMDQAMGGNSVYFSKFYQDLKNKRFVLIVTEPLFTKEQDRSRAFSEENNAWVNWVARPVLCYYEPRGTIEEVRIQFLFPRLDTKDCP
jgi:hypothetical protein